MESIDTSIPKSLNKYALVISSVSYAKKWRASKSHKTRDCRMFNLDDTPIKRNRGTGSARMHHSNQRECEEANFAQINRKEVKKAFKHSASSLASTRNVAQMTQKVTATPTTVCEAVVRIAQGNQVCARNVN